MSEEMFYEFIIWTATMYAKMLQHSREATETFNVEYYRGAARAFLHILTFLQEGKLNHELDF
jgi:hypothetical protein